MGIVEKSSIEKKESSNIEKGIMKLMAIYKSRDQRLESLKVSKTLGFYFCQKSYGGIWTRLNVELFKR